MTAPEEALEQARRAAAEMRADGAYTEDDARAAPVPREVDVPKLYRWALIEPDACQIRSPRRLGAPITAVRRLLLRLLFVYHMQLIAEQTRFNVALLQYTKRLEQRIAELEARPGKEDRP